VGVTHQQLSRIAVDQASAERLRNALQTSGAKYVVHVVVNQADGGFQTLGRSLANNQIDYHHVAPRNDLTARVLDRVKAGQAAAVADREVPAEMAGQAERDALAFSFELEGGGSTAPEAQSPQFVVANATTARLQDAIRELSERYEQFAAVEVFQVAKPNDPLDEAPGDDGLALVPAAMDAMRSDTGKSGELSAAAGTTDSTDDSINAQLGLSVDMDAVADKPGREPEVPEVESRSEPSRQRGRNLGQERFGGKLDGSTATAGRSATTLSSPGGRTNRGLATGGGQVRSPVMPSDRPAPTPSDGVAPRPAESVLGFSPSAGGLPAEQPVSILFVLTSPRPRSSATAGEPSASPDAAAEPVPSAAPPGENQ
jgi:hypothetical protein